MANKGKKFEDVVRKAFEKVPNLDITRLRDAPRKLKGVDNPSDFIVYKKPHEIYVECKSHTGNTLPFSCIREEQITGLEKKSRIYGVKAGVIIWFIDHDITIWSDIDSIITWKAFNKSINVKNLDNLPHILIRGKKKRVYFDYDMDQFIDDLYAGLN